MMYKTDKFWNTVSLMIAATIHLSVAAWAASGWAPASPLSPMGKSHPLSMEINLAMITPSPEQEPVPEKTPEDPETPRVKPKPRTVKRTSPVCYTEPAKPGNPEPVPEPDKAIPQSEPRKVTDVSVPAPHHPRIAPVAEPEEAAQALPVLPPGMTSPLRPRYPRTCRLKREEGDVTVWFHVRGDGRAEDIRVVKSSGHTRLDRAALKAVRGHEFIPAREGGEVSETPCALTIRFHIKS